MGSSSSKLPHERQGKYDSAYLAYSWQDFIPVEQLDIYAQQF